MECASLQTDFCSSSSKRGRGLPNWVRDCWSLRVTQKHPLLICISEPGFLLVHLGPTPSHPGARVPVIDQGLVLQRPSPFQWAQCSSLERLTPSCPTMLGSEVQGELEATPRVGWVDEEDMAMNHGWFTVKASGADSPTHGQNPLSILMRAEGTSPRQSPNRRQNVILGTKDYQLEGPD